MMQTFPADLGRLDRGNPPNTALRRGALESGLLARRRLLLLHLHLQHWIQDALHFQGTYNSDGGHTGLIWLKFEWWIGLYKN